MDSPSPDSPTSTDASGSPLMDDFQFNANRDQQKKIPSVAAQPVTQSPSAPKRPLHTAPSSEKSAFREAKFRRREVKGNTEGRGSGPARGDYISRRDKEELVDLGLVEQLRKEFGDPLLDVIRLKSLC